MTTNNSNTLFDGHDDQADKHRPHHCHEVEDRVHRHDVDVDEKKNPDEQEMTSTIDDRYNEVVVIGSHNEELCAEEDEEECIGDGDWNESMVYLGTQAQMAAALKELSLKRTLHSSKHTVIHHSCSSSSSADSLPLPNLSAEAPSCVQCPCPCNSAQPLFSTPASASAAELSCLSTRFQQVESLVVKLFQQLQLLGSSQKTQLTAFKETILQIRSDTIAQRNDEQCKKQNSAIHLYEMEDSADRQSKNESSTRKENKQQHSLEESCMDKPPTPSTKTQEISKWCVSDQNENSTDIKELDDEKKQNNANGVATTAASFSSLSSFATSVPSASTLSLPKSSSDPLSTSSVDGHIARNHLEEKSEHNAKQSLSPAKTYLSTASVFKRAKLTAPPPSVQHSTSAQVKSSKQTSLSPLSSGSPMASPPKLPVISEAPTNQHAGQTLNVSQSASQPSSTPPAQMGSDRFNGFSASQSPHETFEFSGSDSAPSQTLFSPTRADYIDPQLSAPASQNDEDGQRNKSFFQLFHKSDEESAEINEEDAKAAAAYSNKNKRKRGNGELLQKTVNKFKGSKAAMKRSPHKQNIVKIVEDGDRKAVSEQDNNNGNVTSSTLNSFSSFSRPIIERSSTPSSVAACTSPASQTRLDAALAKKLEANDVSGRRPQRTRQPVQRFGTFIKDDGETMAELARKAMNSADPTLDPEYFKKVQRWKLKQTQILNGTESSSKKKIKKSFNNTSAAGVTSNTAVLDSNSGVKVKQEAVDTDNNADEKQETEDSEKFDSWLHTHDTDLDTESYEFQRL